MQFLWLCWALWALSLVSLGKALTGEQILGSLLQQLQLDQPPVLDKADVEGMVIPSHVRAQYVALLQHSHASRSRGKRFSQNFRGEPCCPWSLGKANGSCLPSTCGVYGPLPCSVLRVSQGGHVRQLLERSRSGRVSGLCTEGVSGWEKGGCAC